MPAQKRRGSGEGTVYRRADGLWAAQLRLPTGERRTLYGAKKSVVQAKLQVLRRGADDGLLPSREAHIRLEQFLDRWLDAIRSSVRESTYVSYELNARRLKRLLGRAQLSALTPLMIQSAYAKLSGECLSARSVLQIHATLHRALEQAVKWGMLARNPSSAVERPRPKRAEMSTLTLEELLRLFEAARGGRMYGMFVLLGTTGMRVGEALGLKWDDVDLAGHRLVVRRAQQRHKGRGLVFVEPKTSRSRRTVHLTALAVEALEQHRTYTDLLRAAARDRWRESGLVFTSTVGDGMEAGVVNDNLNRLLAKAELPRIRVHDLRHTVATILLQGGAHPKLVQELLGHSTITLTLDTYSHVTPAMHQDLTRRLDDAMAAATTLRPAQLPGGAAT
jgi:site-specific recombinase XerD